MSLPNDISRCAGRLNWGETESSFCHERQQCARYLELLARPNCNHVPVAMALRVQGGPCAEIIRVEAR